MLGLHLSVPCDAIRVPIAQRRKARFPQQVSRHLMRRSGREAASVDSAGLQPCPNPQPGLGERLGFFSGKCEDKSTYRLGSVQPRAPAGFGELSGSRGIRRRLLGLSAPQPDPAKESAPPDSCKVWSQHPRLLGTRDRRPLCRVPLAGVPTHVSR